MPIHGTGDVAGSDDPCDLRFRVDLLGVRQEALSTISVGDELEVALDVRGAATSVVCRTSVGAVAGTLAAFRGLARLIRCLSQGEQYIALVESVSRLRCAVFVRRIEP